MGHVAKRYAGIVTRVVQMASDIERNDPLADPDPHPRGRQFSHPELSGRPELAAEGETILGVHQEQVSPSTGAGTSFGRHEEQYPINQESGGVYSPGDPSAEDAPEQAEYTVQRSTADIVGSYRGA